MSVISGIMNSNSSKDNAETMSNAQIQSTQMQIDAANAAAGAQIQAAEMGAGAMIQSAEIGAGAVTDAAKIAAEMQWKMYAQSREDQLPWMKAGSQALGQLQSKIAKGPGEFVEDPGYQFRLEEGNKNLLAKAAATGNLQSGRTGKALTEYGQDYASNEYDKFINRYYQSLAPLQSLAGLGQSTATNMGNQGIGVGNNLANIYSNQGNQLAGIASQTGSGLASLYQNSGNALANQYMNVGNIGAQGAMNLAGYAAQGNAGSANAWSGALNSGFNTLAQYYGNKPTNNYYGSGNGMNWNTYTPSSYDVGAGYSPDNYM